MSEVQEARQLRDEKHETAKAVADRSLEKVYLARQEARSISSLKRPV
jgi:hypothetical protein